MEMSREKIGMQGSVSKCPSSLAQAKSVRTLGKREPCREATCCDGQVLGSRSERYRQTSPHKLGATYFLLPAVVVSAREVTHGSVERIK